MEFCPLPADDSQRIVFYFSQACNNQEMFVWKRDAGGPSALRSLRDFVFASAHVPQLPGCVSSLSVKGTNFGLGAMSNAQLSICNSVLLRNCVDTKYSVHVYRNLHERTGEVAVQSYAQDKR